LRPTATPRSARSVSTHQALKNSHGGINVYVRVAPDVPALSPPVGVLLWIALGTAGLVGIALWQRRRVA
jgi:hypothetical protein